jgi:hypothetical protein
VAIVRPGRGRGRTTVGLIIQRAAVPPSLGGHQRDGGVEHPVGEAPGCSYQVATLTSVPRRPWSASQSKVDEAGSWLKSTDTSGASCCRPSTPFELALGSRRHDRD